MRLKETASCKICEFTKKFSLWVAGGNHRWEVYLRLDSDQVPDPGKHRSCVLATIYWWPDYSAKTVQEVTLLTTRQNVDGSLRSEMSFHDKVCSSALLFWASLLNILFLQVAIVHAQYQRQPVKPTNKLDLHHGNFKGCHKWTLQGKNLTATLLGLNVQSLDPLFQLVHNCSDVYELVEALVTRSSLPGTSHAPNLKPITTVTNFKVLQGLDISSKKALLLKVYKGKYTWRKMENKASVIKARAKVMAALVVVLEHTTWDQVVKAVGGDWLEEFIHQWVTSFCKVQLGKKDLPEHFKEHALLLVSRRTTATLDPATYWTHTFNNSSKVLSCHLPFGEYRTTIPHKHYCTSSSTIVFWNTF